MRIFSALSRCIHRRRLSEINRCNWRINISSTFSHNGANKIYGGSQSNASCRMSTSSFHEPKYEWPKSDQFHAILDRQPAPIRHLLRQMPNFGNQDFCAKRLHMILALMAMARVLLRLMQEVIFNET